jgi:hypothetical protein
MDCGKLIRSIFFNASAIRSNLRKCLGWRKTRSTLFLKTVKRLPCLNKRYRDICKISVALQMLSDLNLVRSLPGKLLIPLTYILCNIYLTHTDTDLNKFDFCVEMIYRAMSVSEYIFERQRTWPRLQVYTLTGYLREPMCVCSQTPALDNYQTDETTGEALSKLFALDFLTAFNLVQL